MAPRLDVRGLTVELPTRAGWIKPVNDVSFALSEGETLGIVGESGSGKTMLALALMGLEPPGARHSGEAWLHRSRNGAGGNGSNLLAASDDDMRAIRGGEIAMIFQEPMTALNPVVRVGAQIEEAIRVHAPGLGRGEIRRRALEAIERAAIPEPERRARQYPHQLSGGLRQRAMIAMALAAGPSVLIADEPTTALDVTVQKQILELLETLRRDLRLSLLFITHDLGVVAQIADRVAVMYAGQIVEMASVHDLFTRPLHPYTQGLLASIPRVDQPSKKLESIPGSVPNLIFPPSGCRYHPRCPHAMPVCKEQRPPMTVEGTGHNVACFLYNGAPVVE